MLYDMFVATSRERPSLWGLHWSETLLQFIGRRLQGVGGDFRKCL